MNNPRFSMPAAALAAAFAAAAAFSPFSGAAEKESALAQALAAPQAAPRATWQLAQAQQASCESDGRRVPRGTKVCQSGKIMECTPRGAWRDTGKRC